MKGGETHTYTYTQKTMFILNMFTYKLFHENKSSNIIVVQVYEIVKIQMHLQSNYLTFWFKNFHRCVDLGKIFLNDFLKNYLDKL